MTPGERELAIALRPWERRLTQEALRRWLLRGGIGALALASMVLLIGWLVPQPEAELRPWALELALGPLLAAAVVALWPRAHLRRAAELDARLGFGDRLATAWAFRGSEQTIARLQRSNAIHRLQQRAPSAPTSWRPAPGEFIALGVCALAALVLLVVPSPQQAVLDRQIAEDLAVQQASERLDALQQEVSQLPALSPDQEQQINELLQQAQAQLKSTRSQQQGAAVLTHLQDQLAQQLADPNADLRDEALAAMSETLAAEPRTQALGSAIQREDAHGVSGALEDLADKADQLSDVERQSLSRALQRASNVGRADARSAQALRDAAQALTAGNPAQAREALAQADAALRQAIQSSQAQASINQTLQRLRGLQDQLASGKPLPNSADPRSSEAGGASVGEGYGLLPGTPVALDVGGPGSRTVHDPTSGQGGGAGIGAAGEQLSVAAGQAGQTAENVFVPGRIGEAATSQDLVDQPFTVRGAPRPYREVLSQYAQSSRDYVDRPEISPAVRDLVKQYFQQLEEGQ